jgi:soluble lytic murein transglycosylase-like protein
MPVTFRALNKKWGLLNKGKISSMPAFLFTPGSNIDLGGRWFKDELLRRENGHLVFAVAEHNAGYPAVRRWKKQWRDFGRANDIEYMVDTIGYLQTKTFAKKVLTDLAIVTAIGMDQLVVPRGFQPKASNPK